LTLETMATRSSNSTHASSPSSSSVEQASVRTAAKIQLHDPSTPRKISITQIPIQPRPTLPPPQIVQTAATPHRNLAPSSVPLSATPSQSPYIPPSPPLPPRSPCGSSFVEALPASYPSRSPAVSPLPSPGAPNPFDYKPLPLANPQTSPNRDQSSQQPARPKTRARASTLGSGLKPSFASETIKVETPEEKRARVEAEFDKLLVSSNFTRLARQFLAERSLFLHTRTRWNYLTDRFVPRCKVSLSR
jgi:hypothetical protein